MGIVQLSWDQYDDLVRAIVKQVRNDNFEPELIVGIARGGLPLLTTISSCLNVREVGVIFVQKTVTDAQFADKHPSAILYGTGLPYTVACKNVLLVDDIIRSGQSLNKSLEVLNDLGAASIKVAALYKQITVYDFAPYVAVDVKKDDWIVFPWDKL